MTLSDLKRHHPRWFNKGNQRFFGDKNCRLQLGASGRAHLVRETDGWSDMFDGVKKTHFRINPVSEEFQILPLVEQIFASRAGVQDYLNEH